MRMVQYYLPDKVAAQLDMLKQSPRGEITITAEDLRGEDHPVLEDSLVDQGPKPSTREIVHVEPHALVETLGRRDLTSRRITRVPYAHHPSEPTHTM